MIGALFSTLIPYGSTAGTIMPPFFMDPECELIFCLLLFIKS